MRIAVTGTTGFVGSALVLHLASAGHDVVGIQRFMLPQPDLKGVDTVIHCAGLAHLVGKSAPSDDELDLINNKLAVNLARHAANAGVKRFVFVSTVNVVAGNPSPLKPDMPYCPLSKYGASKARAERALLQMADLEVVVARPSLVYGVGAPGNLKSLTRVSKSGIPLPFGLANNRRSLLSISNAVRALEFLASMDMSQLGARVFHLADPVPLSTKQMISVMRSSMGQDARLVAIPPAAINILLSILGKRYMAEQLFGDMVVDSTLLAEAGFVFRDGMPDLEAMAVSVV